MSKTKFPTWEVVAAEFSTAGVEGETTVAFHIRMRKPVIDMGHARLLEAAPGLYEAAMAQQTADQHYLTCPQCSSRTGECDAWNGLAKTAYESREAALLLAPTAPA